MATKRKAPAKGKEENTVPGSVGVQIPAPDFRVVNFTVIGTAPLVIHKFSKKAREQIMATQQAGSKAKTKKVREARDFDRDYKEAMHISDDGWCGIPAGAFRAGMISACRTVGFVMTRAKLAFNIQEDGFDADDGMPLVRIEGEPQKHIAMARNATGVVDVRCRPMWKKWRAEIRVQYDAGMLSQEDVGNLLARVGMQVGLCEGRPDSKASARVGWGTFRMAEAKDLLKAVS